MTITLYRGENCWAAHYSGPGAEGILDLFGTLDLPCAFAPEASADVVLTEIARLNPEADVRLGAAPSR